MYRFEHDILVSLGCRPGSQQFPFWTHIGSASSLESNLESGAAILVSII